MQLFNKRHVINALNHRKVARVYITLWACVHLKKNYTHYRETSPATRFRNLYCNVTAKKQYHLNSYKTIHYNKSAVKRLLMIDTEKRLTGQLATKTFFPLGVISL